MYHEVSHYAIFFSHLLFHLCSNCLSILILISVRSCASLSVNDQVSNTNELKGAQSFLKTSKFLG